MKSVCVLFILVQVGKLRQQLEDMETAKQDLVREYEQQLKKFQEEVSFKKRRLVFSSQLICDEVSEMLGIVVVLKCHGFKASHSFGVCVLTEESTEHKVMFLCSASPIFGTLGERGDEVICRNKNMF